MSLVPDLLGELTAALRPLSDAATDPWLLDQLLAQLAVDAGQLGGDGLVTQLAAIGQAVSELETVITTPPDTLAALEAVLTAARTLIDAVGALSHGLPAGSEQLAGDLVQLVVLRYLAHRWPLGYQIAVAVGLIDRGLTQLGGIVKVRMPTDVLQGSRIEQLFSDPAAVLRGHFPAQPLATVDDAHLAMDVAVGRFGGLASALGLPWRYGYAPDDAAQLGEFAARLDHALLLLAPQSWTEDEPFGVVVTLSPADQDDLGVVIAPFGAFTIERDLDAWHVSVQGSAEIQAVALGGGQGFQVLAANGALEANLAVHLSQAPTPDTAPYVAGTATGTRLELRGANAHAVVGLAPGARSVDLGIDVPDAVFVLTADGADGFLGTVIGSNELRASIAFGLGYTTGEGLHLKSGTGLTAQLPVALTVGPLSVRQVELTLVPAQHAVAVTVTATLSVTLGPVVATVQGLGVRASVTLPSSSPGPQGGGARGAADLAIGLKPPSGVALTVDAGPVTGGGALVFYPDRELYAGEMQLQFEQIAVRAVGILTTGRPGYSLLVLVSAQFPPVQLGLGFMLIGVGGLLGIHRTVAVEALRAGLKAGALSAVLSPPDPKADPAQLMASLAGLFPPAAGRYVFAPTARIVWGSPVLITIDLCLVLELPSPVRLVALGRMRALLPEDRDPVVRLQVDVLGVIDFDQQTAAVDATLIDSRIAQFALTGDLALRMSWGPAPVFLLAVGGFHPRFAAPPGFPALDRVAVALASGDNPKLRLEAYLALTSNTVQFGAHLDVGARAGSFSIGGFMAFDALVTLSPLAFEVDIAAQLAVKAGTHTLLSISLALTLSGPRPWHAHGRASFSILFFDISFGFDVTIGDPAPAALPNPVDVAPLLLAALADPRAWTAQLPVGADVVTLRTLESGQAILAHPLATLQVRQRVAPLDRMLDRFGTSVPSGATRFGITLATVGGARATLTPLQDRFAPAQFTAMSDDQKLSAPSFEAMISGAALGADGYTTGAPVTVSVTYEQALVTAEGITPPSHQRLPLPLDVFATLTATTGAPVPAFAVRDTA
jgi:hypothetical protein